VKAPARTTWQQLALLRRRTLFALGRGSAAVRPQSANTPALARALAGLRGRIPVVPPAVRRPLAIAINLILAGATLVVVAALAAGLGPRLLGYSPIVVYGGSMADSIPVGSIAVAEKVLPEDIAVGDVIVFYPPATSANRSALMHRVVSIREEDGQRFFHTKGDANAAPDPWEIGIQGHGSRVVYSVPYVGYFVSFAREPLGWALLLVLPLTYLGIGTLKRIWAEAPPAP